MANVEMIRPYVEQKIAEVLGIEKVEVDPQGDLPIRSGSAAYFARLIDAPDGPVLQVFSPMLHDVEKTSELLEKLNEMNTMYLFMRYFWANGSVIAAVDLFAEDIQPSEIELGLKLLARNADTWDDDLAKQFGGKVFFQEPPAEGANVTDPAAPPEPGETASATPKGGGTSPEKTDASGEENHGYL